MQFMDDSDRLHKGLNLAEILEYDTSESEKVRYVLNTVKLVLLWL